MFFSKIWFFVVALAAAVALTIALVMPRPAARAVVGEEKHRLVVACGVVDILLADDARNRLDLTATFGRAEEVVSSLAAASGVDKIDEARMKAVRTTASDLMKGIKGERTPDFAVLVDRKGRVVARVRLDENDFGDVVAGRPLIDDALAGYMRDDLWAYNGSMYFVTAAPVIRPPNEYVGAVVLGHGVTNALSQRLVKGLDVDVGFYLGKDGVAGSKTIAVDHNRLLDQVKKLSGADLSRDCEATRPIDVTTGKEDYAAVVARLPGEAGARQAYYSVFIRRAAARGFAGTLSVVNQSDLGFGNFPWILVGGGFLIALALGIGLMFVESDRPLRKLSADAVRLAKGEIERLSEDAHPGKFGSIARSVNIHIDKLGREAKTAKKDLDQLLGPAPEGGLGTIDLLATALPARPGGGGPASPPPPSDFKFSTSTTTPAFGAPTAPVAAAAAPPRPPPARPATPPPVKPAAPPPPSSSAIAHASTLPGPGVAGGDKPAIVDDILASGEHVDPYFKEVYEQFVALKKQCNEPTAGLTYAKFAEKLVRNRDELIAKNGCKEVKFTVYVKEGKAALKATPVKDA